MANDQKNVGAPKVYFPPGAYNPGYVTAPPLTKVHWNLAIVDTHDVSEKCPLFRGVRYIEVCSKSENKCVYVVIASTISWASSYIRGYHNQYEYLDSNC